MDDMRAPSGELDKRIYGDVAESNEVVLLIIHYVEYSKTIEMVSSAIFVYDWRCCVIQNTALIQRELPARKGGGES